MTGELPRPGLRRDDSRSCTRLAAIPDPVASFWGGGTEDTVAFEEVYRLHYQEVVSFLRRLGASREDAEEVAQEVFLVVLLRIAQLDDPTRFPKWIRVIARHAWYDHRRSRSSKHYTLEEPWGPQELVRLEPAWTNDCGPEEWAEDADAVRRVCRMAEAFPERMREIFDLYFLHQHNTNEIASLMDISPRAVSRYLHEVRRRVRDWWLATEQKDELDLSRQGSYRSSRPQSTRPMPKSAPKAPGRPRTWKATLPSVREREVLKLSDQGLTPAQIAKQFGISANNARVTLCHARKKRQPQAT